jgi:hypothetical protein
MVYPSHGMRCKTIRACDEIFLLLSFAHTVFLKATATYEGKKCRGESIISFIILSPLLLMFLYDDRLGSWTAWAMAPFGCQDTMFLVLPVTSTNSSAFYVLGFFTITKNPKTGEEHMKHHPVRN